MSTFMPGELRCPATRLSMGAVRFTTSQVGKSFYLSRDGALIIPVDINKSALENEFNMNAQEQRNAQDRAYQHVKAQILSIDLKPGEWIKAQDIASSLEVSRTPVREALSRLEQEGFVRRDRGWGYVVCSVTLKDAREIYSVREALEVLAAREALSHIDAKDIATLDVLLKKSEQARARMKLAAFRLNTRSFHTAIAQLARNDLLAQMLGQLEHHVQRLGAIVFEKHPTRMDEVIDENRAILTALMNGDLILCEAAVRQHVRCAWKSYLLYVADSPELSVTMGIQQDGRRTGGQRTI